MESFWKIVDRVIRQADVLLLVLDSRFVQETRNTEIEEKIKSFRKPIIYVITKSDLIGKEEAESWKRKLRPMVFTSAREHQGSIKLRERISIEASKACPGKHSIKVGVLGYPNTGKSSLINMLKGRKSAPVSSRSGYTRHIQNIRTRNILLIDTPGVIPYMEKDDEKHAMIGSVDPAKIRDPDLIVLELLRKFPGKLEAFYGVRKGGDGEETIEAIALKRGVLMKGGRPDVMRMSRMILKSFQKGEIK